MKIRGKLSNSHSLVVLLFFNLFFKWASTEMVSEEYCDVDVEAAAMTQWYTQVFDFLQTQQNTTQHILDLEVKLDKSLRQLNEKMEQLKQKSHEKLHDVEVKLEQLKSPGNDLNEKLNDLEVKLERLNEKVEELQKHPTTSGDIVIQRRMDGSVDFYRPWADYKQGFGNSSGEFFIGLEKLHKLTNSRPYELLVVMEDWENDRRYAKYSQFAIGSESEKYALKLLGTYSGTAGDSMILELGQKFTTKDQDNDAYAPANCAVLYTGAWWYKACHQSNLNGRYLRGTITEYAVGVHWLPFKGHYYSLKFVEMIVRPN